MPVYASDKATLTFSPSRDNDGERVVVVSWHQGEDTVATLQMSLSTVDIERLRDFCQAWLSMDPPPEPSEAA